MINTKKELSFTLEEIQNLISNVSLVSENTGTSKTVTFETYEPNFYNWNINITPDKILKIIIDKSIVSPLIEGNIIEMVISAGCTNEGGSSKLFEMVTIDGGFVGVSINYEDKNNKNNNFSYYTGVFINQSSFTYENNDKFILKWTTTSDISELGAIKNNINFKVASLSDVHFKIVTDYVDAVTIILVEAHDSMLAFGYNCARSVTGYFKVNGVIASEKLTLNVGEDYYISDSKYLKNGNNIIEFYTEENKLVSNSYVYEYISATFTLTLDFGDEGTQDIVCEKEVKKIDINLNFSSNINLKLTFNDNSTSEAQILDKPNTRQYMESLLINGQTYPVVEGKISIDLVINNNTTLTFQNGTIHYYAIVFYNDNFLLQSERLAEGTLPTYKGATPVKAGYVFTGWTPALYPVDKAQDYQANFEKEPFTITIADSGSNNFSIVWLDNQSTEKARKFSKPITSIRINQHFEPYSHIVSLILGYGDTENSTCLISYDQNNVIPQNFKIGGTTYNFGTDYSVNIDSNTTINIVTNTRYFIRFLNYDDSVLETKYVYSGVTPTYTGDTPYQKGYTFTGWNPVLYPADKNQDYKATFTIQAFTIRFLNDDGSELETKQVEYGTTPTYTGTTPTKEGYTFNGWSPTLYPANKNQDYTATYRNNAFALTLYKNTAEKNRIDKTQYLTSVGEITGYLRNETNIINPSIVIEYDKVIDFNYVYVSTFNRYYFVTNITSVRTNLWRLDMSCDVLMTYKDTILNYECYVSRNENDYNEKIEDKYLPLEYEKVVEYILQQPTTGANADFFKGFSALITTLATSPEVNLENENIDITTPFNDLDGVPAKTNIYETGSSNFKVVQMISDLGAYASCLNTIANALIQDNTKASYVQSIIVFPIWNPAMYDQIGYKTMTDFYYGSEKLPLGGTYNVVLKGDTIAPIKVATIYIRPKFNNFLDYDPYTTYEIWLPFHGWVKLPSEQVVGNYLNVYYIINTSSTKGTIIIRQQSDSAVILEVDCTIGVEIPISTTNGEDIKRRQTSDAINLAVQGVGGVFLGATGVLTGNPLLALGGVTMASGAITGGISSSMTNRVESQGKVSDGNAGLYSDRVVKIRRTSPIVAVDDISKYAKYIGRPLQTNVKLNTLTGYTIVGGVHIENLATATDNEKTDIENQLRKGVVI